jgi:Flp pilus assembly protein TadG
MRATALSIRCFLVARPRRQKSIPTIRRGVTMLETALVAPLVLILLLAMMDLGLAVYSNNTLAEAARAGTRYATVHGLKSISPAGPVSDDANVEAAVRDYAPGILPARLVVQSSWPDGNNAPGSRVTVTVTYSYNLGVSSLLGFRALSLSSTSTMVIQH